MPVSLLHAELSRPAAKGATVAIGRDDEATVPVPTGRPRSWGPCWRLIWVSTNSARFAVAVDLCRSYW
jgi:hypothetical protein